MQNLQSVTKGILKRVEEVTGKSIQFMRDDNLAVLSTLQMARHGAEFHVMRYRPSNDPIDYFVAFQAGFVLRLFECDPSSRFDFLPSSDNLMPPGAAIPPLVICVTFPVAAYGAPTRIIRRPKGRQYQGKPLALRLSD